MIFSGGYLEMTMENTEYKELDILKEIPLFHQIDDSILSNITPLLRKRMFKKGEGIFSEGSMADGFYIVVKGMVKVYKLSYDGKEQILHIVESRELLGAVSAFAGTPYPANAEAVEKTEALFFRRDDLFELIRKEPSIVMNMMANLAARLQHFTRMIENLSLKEVPGRLAAYMLYLCERKGCSDVIEMDISKGQLASLLGTIPETLSRILRKMSDAGIIEVRGRAIRIIRKSVLKEILDGEKAGW
jgi:CRP/FNR family transcriptional regulator